MIEGIFIPQIVATKGEVTIPSLSVLVIRMKRPVLTRRPVGTDPELGLFDLQAAVTYFLSELWADEDYDKEIKLYVGKKPLKVLPVEGSRLVVNSESLRIEGVNIEWQKA